MKTFIVCILLLFHVCAQAQNRHHIRLEGAVLGSTGSYDLPANGVYGEYQYRLVQNLYATSSIGLLWFNRPDWYASKYDFALRATAQSFELGINYKIPIIKPIYLETEFGTYARRWNWVYNRELYPPKPSTAYDVPDHYTTVGYKMGLGVYAQILKPLGVHTRIIFQNDTEGDNVMTLRIGASYSF